MKRNIEEGRKIPFLFTPIPKFVFEKSYFEDEDFFRFLCFAFNRTTFDTKVIFHCGQSIQLEPLEFIFGRGHWSEELNLTPRKVRTFMCQLTGHKLATMIASKSASKFTVYKWLWERFPGNFCQQSCQQSATKAPANRPHIKNKNKEKEQQHAESALPAAASLEGKAKKQLDLLPQQEHAAITSLYHHRLKTQVITNPEAWFIKCIQEGWHLENKLVLPEEKIELSDFEKNKAHAKKLLQQFESVPGLHICVRNDFLELGKDRRQRWQIFFSEAPKDFLEQIELALKKIQICTH